MLRLYPSKAKRSLAWFLFPDYSGVSAVCRLYRIEADRLDGKLFQFGLEGSRIFDLGYLDRHVLFFEKAFHDGLRNTQR